MVFTSTVFLFLFLPVFLAGYALLPPQRRTLAILVGSYAFYAWWRPDFALVFALSTLLAIAAGRAVARGRGAPAGRRALAWGVGAQLATLAYFKYADFGVASLNALLEGVGVRPLPLLEVVLPIGISFYVFQAISYVVDVARRDAPDDARAVDVAAYIALFPQLIAGPIVRYKTIADRLAAPVLDRASFAAGAERFMLGFVKKVLVADAVAPIADGAFALANPSAAEAWLGLLAFAVQLLFDFSGYSDMAIGLGRMLGFRFPENFDRPYQARSITEFWRRWHISLSTWLRDYLYVPLGGNRRGPLSTYRNLALVMLLGGLWHGAAWTFVLWGAWHGAWLIAERLRGVRGDRPAWPGAFGTLGTFAVVLFGWVLFRADGLPAALAMFGGLVGAHGFGVTGELAWLLEPRAVATLAVGLTLAFVPRPGDRPGLRLRLALGAPPVALLVPLFVLGVGRALADTASPFLYFRF
ncbi:MAG: MBOAT family protein [Trueperaceae bacterium]